MALMEVNFFSKALMRPVTMNVILPVDKVFLEKKQKKRTNHLRLCICFTE